jgi:excisionase family DNA binding protein
LSDAPSSPVGGLPSWVYDAAHGPDAKSPASCGPRSRLLTLKEAADQLALSTRTVRRLVARGDLDAVRLGRSVRIAPSSLEKILNLNEVSISNYLKHCRD